MPVSTCRKFLRATMLFSLMICMICILLTSSNLSTFAQQWQTLLLCLTPSIIVFFQYTHATYTRIVQCRSRECPTDLPTEKSNFSSLIDLLLLLTHISRYPYFEPLHSFSYTHSLPFLNMVDKHKFYTIGRQRYDVLFEYVVIAFNIYNGT